MNLSELQSVQARERQSDSLQELRPSFYRDAADYIAELREERTRAAAEAGEPFEDPRVTQLTDDIRTAQGTIEAIYERRVGKVVKLASLAAADMPTEETGLTTEEQELYETLVGAIETHREGVLATLTEEGPDDTPDGSPGTDARDGDADRPTTEAAAATGHDEGVDAADVMAPEVDGPPVRRDDGAGASDDGTGASDDGAGASDDADDGDADARDADARDVEPGDVDAGDVEPDDLDASDGEPGDVDGSDGEPGDGGGSDSDRAADRPTGESRADDEVADSIPGENVDGSPGGGDSNDGTDRTTVRITEDVGAILGVDEREYDLATDDVVTLPAANADPLIERDAAEPLE